MEVGVLLCCPAIANFCYGCDPWIPAWKSPGTLYLLKETSFLIINHAETHLSNSSSNHWYYYYCNSAGNMRNGIICGSKMQSTCKKLHMIFAFNRCLLLNAFFMLTSAFFTPLFMLYSKSKSFHADMKWKKSKLQRICWLSNYYFYPLLIFKTFSVEMSQYEKLRENCKM